MRERSEGGAAAAPAAGGPAAPERPAVVKKYANRRLYNTATSSYVTLDELARMVRAGRDFVVYDAKSGEEITRSVLTQIILEEDSKGRNLLPITFLRQLISFYDDGLHAFLPRYLELSMENFTRHQHQIRSYMEETFGRFFPMQQFEEMARQNMALLQRATGGIFPTFELPPARPGATPADHEAAAPGASEASPPADAPRPGAADMQELKAKLDELQRQLEELNRSAKTPGPVE